MARRRMKIPSKKGGRRKGNNQKDMLKQLEMMQDQIAEAQAKLEEQEFTGTSGGGAVEAIVQGNLHLKSLKIDPDAVDEDDIEMLEDMIIAAVSEAQRQAASASETTNTEALTSGLPGDIDLSGLNIPGF